MSQGSRDSGQMQGQMDNSWTRPLSHTQGWGMKVLHTMQIWPSPNNSKYLPFLVGVRSCTQIYLWKIHTYSSLLFLIFSCFSGKVISYRPLQYRPEGSTLGLASIKGFKHCRHLLPLTPKTSQS